MTRPVNIAGPQRTPFVRSSVSPQSPAPHRDDLRPHISSPRRRSSIAELPETVPGSSSLAPGLNGGIDGKDRRAASESLRRAALLLPQGPVLSPTRRPQVDPSAVRRFTESALASPQGSLSPPSPSMSLRAESMAVSPSPHHPVMSATGASSPLLPRRSAPRTACATPHGQIRAVSLGSGLGDDPTPQQCQPSSDDTVASLAERNAALHRALLRRDVRVRRLEQQRDELERCATTAALDIESAVEAAVAEQSALVLEECRHTIIAEQRRLDDTRAAMLAELRGQAAMLQHHRSAIDASRATFDCSLQPRLTPSPLRIAPSPTSSRTNCDSVLEPQLAHGAQHDLPSSSMYSEAAIDGRARLYGVPTTPLLYNRCLPDPSELAPSYSSGPTFEKAKTEREAPTTRSAVLPPLGAKTAAKEPVPLSPLEKTTTAASPPRRLVTSMARSAAGTPAASRQREHDGSSAHERGTGLLDSSRHLREELISAAAQYHSLLLLAAVAAFGVAVGLLMAHVSVGGVLAVFGLQRITS